MESVTGETMLQNQCNVNVHVILYNIITRQDINSETALNWGRLAPNRAWVLVEQDNDTALTNAAVLGQSAESYTSIDGSWTTSHSSGQVSTEQGSCQ